MNQSAKNVNNLDLALKPVPSALHLTQTISSSVVLGSSFSIDAGAEYFQVVVEGDAVRLTVNATNPSATVGFKRAVDWEGILSRSELVNSRWIRVTADATLQIAQLRA